MTSLPRFDLAPTGDETQALDLSWAPMLDIQRPDSPRHRWLIWHQDGSVASHSFSPPATRVEVESWYPGAAAEPEPEAQP